MCGVAHTTVIPSRSASRAIATLSARSKAPSSSAGRMWQWRSITSTIPLPVAEGCALRRGLLPQRFDFRAAVFLAPERVVLFVVRLAVVLRFAVDFRFAALARPAFFAAAFLVVRFTALARPAFLAVLRLA